MATIARLSSVFRSPLHHFRNRVLIKPYGKRTAFEQVRFSTSKLPWQVDVKVQKDVILYAYNNDKFHRVINLFALTSFAICAYLAESLMSLRDVPVPEVKEGESLPWYRSVNFAKKKKFLATLFLGIGSLTLCGSWIYSLRIVKNIVLRKGGKDLTFITYAPFNKVRYLDAPLKNVSATHRMIPTLLPIKVKGYMGPFLIDTKGDFKNISLFDATVGLKRTLK